MMKLHLLFAGILFLALPSQAQQPVHKPLPVHKDVKIGKLSNGLTYYIQKNTEPAKRAVLYLVTNVGSLMEGDDQLGLAHFTEHMAFNGTRDFPKNELIEYLQKAGVKFGADVNASTSFNETIFKLPLPTDNPEVFEKSFSILANWAGMVSFETDAIDRERGIIIEEGRSRGKDASERIQKQILPSLVNHSRYASRMPIGTEDILRNFKPERIKQFYKDWYRPDLQAVIAVGDFDPAQVEAFIKKNFSVLKNPSNPRKRLSYSIPSSTETAVEILTDKEQTSTRLQILVRHQGKTPKTTTDLLESMQRSIFNRMMGSRVAELRQLPNTPILLASIGYGKFLADVDAFTMTISPKAGQLEKAVQKVLEIKEQVKQFGFTETELQRAKLSLLNTLERQWKERDKNNSINYVNEYVKHFLTGEGIPGIDYEYHFLKNNMDKIQLAAINKLLPLWDIKTNRIVILEAPEKDKASLPDQRTLLSWIDEANKNVKPYVDEVVSATLLSEKPKGSKITSQKEDASSGVTELFLENGVRVVLKPTTFKNDQIIINGYSYGGTSLAPDAAYTSASLAALLVNRSGLGSLTKAQISKMLSGRSVNISASISDFTEGISGSSSPEELETAMQLVYLYFTQPRKDTNIWSGILSQQQASLSNRGINPIQVFQDTVAAVLNNYHPRKMPENPQALKEASIDEAYRFYKTRFEDAAGFTFVLVGNLDTAKVKPLIAQYLGALPSLNRKDTFVDPGIKIPSGHFRKTVYKGLEEKSRVQLVFHSDYQYSESNNIQMDALKEVVNYRLLNRLRAKESGVYTPSVNVSYTKVPNQKFNLTISFNCAPGNVDNLIQASLEEIAAIRKTGPSLSEIEKFIAATQRMEETQVNSNVYWAYSLRTQYMLNDGQAGVLKKSEALKQVTTESVKAAAKQYLSGSDLIEFVLMPEKKQ
jgi:zinc protease